MSSISAALTQVDRYVTFVKRFVYGRQEIFQLEARYNVCDDPEWLLSEEYRDLCDEFCGHLEHAYDDLVVSAHRASNKIMCLEWHKKRLTRLRAILRAKERSSVYHPFNTPEYADQRILRVFVDALKKQVYIPKDYDQWRDSISLNPFYVPRFVLDEIALCNPAFWLNSQSRLVLLNNGMQVRWMAGRVLLDVAYHNIHELKVTTKRRNIYLQISLHSGQTEVLNITWVDLRSLQSELERLGLRLTLGKNEGATTTK